MDHVHCRAKFTNSTVCRGGNISILLVSPYQEDYASLRRILHNDGWRIRRCDCGNEAVAHLDSTAPSIVLCESNLPDGTWKDVLARMQALKNPPLLLVISRHADENLWGEVLNLGGYDVLLKPFERSEVTRVLGMAWRQWFRPSESRLAQNYA